jgi:Na+-translocating ferredoxin:NAD+ oxidoreductase RnfD subunit
MEWKGSPIFNPVVLGFFVLEILSDFIPSLKLSFVSWWGASFSFGPVPVALILIAIWIIFSFKVWRKWAAALSYLGFFAIFAFIALSFNTTAGQSALDFLKFTFLNSTIYFFTFVMLAEPRTSPLMKHQQIIYGLIAAIFSTISLLTNFPTSALLAILVPNLYFFILKWLMIRKMTAGKSTPIQA